MLHPITIQPQNQYNTKRMGIAPIPVYTLHEVGEGWLTREQVADFFSVSVRDIPVLIEKGLKPPARLTYKNIRFSLSSVLEFNELLKNSAFGA